MDGMFLSKNIFGSGYSTFDEVCIGLIVIRYFQNRCVMIIQTDRV